MADNWDEIQDKTREICLLTAHLNVELISNIRVFGEWTDEHNERKLSRLDGLSERIRIKTNELMKLIQEQD